MSNEEEEFNNEEEEFGGDEVVIDGDDGEIVFDEPQESQIDDTQIDEERQKREEDERVKEELVKRFNPTTGAARRLINDLKIMMDSNPKELGFSCQPKNEDIFTWEVRLFGFEKGTPMMKDIEKYQKQTGRDYVELSVTFPPDYPINPPFVRVVRPRFVPRTGRVTAGGSLCTDILTSESWNPMYGIDSLMVNILSENLNEILELISLEMIHTLWRKQELHTKELLAIMDGEFQNGCPINNIFNKNVNFF